MDERNQRRRTEARARKKRYAEQLEQQESLQALQKESERLRTEAMNAILLPQRLMAEHRITPGEFAAYLQKIAGTEIERAFRAGMAALQRENERFSAALAQRAEQTAARRPKRLRNLI